MEFGKSYHLGVGSMYTVCVKAPSLPLEHRGRYMVAATYIEVRIGCFPLGRGYGVP